MARKSNLNVWWLELKIKFDDKWFYNEDAANLLTGEYLNDQMVAYGRLDRLLKLRLVEKKKELYEHGHGYRVVWRCIL